MRDAALIERIARELRVPPRGATAALALFDGGATVPFVARYRKEATGGLDEVQLRAIAERAKYLSELGMRAGVALEAIRAQGKLTPELERAITLCETKAELEHLYAPFRSKRRTRGQIAKELGLEPLADLIWKHDASESPEAAARRFVAHIPRSARLRRPSTARSTSGRAHLRRPRRAPSGRRGAATRHRAREKATKFRTQTTKFDNYASFAEPVAKLAPHRYLAICRGENEGVLRPSFELDDARVTRELERLVGLRAGDAWESCLLVRSTRHSRLLVPAARSAVRGVAGRCGRDAVKVFARTWSNCSWQHPSAGAGCWGSIPGNARAASASCSTRLERWSSTASSTWSRAKTPSEPPNKPSPVCSTAIPLRPWR
ncbi:MAG: hypothetical protein IPI67_17815 [Myxococcales bacterium]|nr:hypothetical protein [Myxococcales bacterium]